MATLLTLPNETLLQVIDLTRPEGIWSFVRCCKRIWFLGEEDLRLHRQDFDRYRAPFLGLLKNTPGYGLEAYQFLSEFLLQLRRTLYVRRLSIGSGNPTLSHVHRPFAEKTSTLIDQTCSLFFKTIKMPDDEVSEGEERLRCGETNAVFCLMLLLLPNLKTLTITNCAGQGYADIISKMSKAIKSPHGMYQGPPGPLALNKLESITIIETGFGVLTDERPGIFEACMLLPSLRRIEGKYIIGASGFCSRWPSEQGFRWVSNVTEIIFRRSAINTNAFTRLLSGTQNLRRLTYSFSHPLSPLNDYIAWSLKEVLVQYVAGTLEYLNLDLDELAWHEPSQYIGSLSQLRFLISVRIRASMLIEFGDRPDRQVDLLPLFPPSLEQLTLLSTREKLRAVFTLQDLRIKREDCREDCLPNLKKFGYGRSVTIADGLRDECAGVGINLKRLST